MGQIDSKIVKTEEWWDLINSLRLSSTFQFYQVQKKDCEKLVLKSTLQMNDDTLNPSPGTMTVKFCFNSCVVFFE